MEPNLTPEQKINETIAQQKRFGIEPTVSANELVNPPDRVNPPVPTVGVPSDANANLIGNITNNTQSYIQSQSEEAQKAKDLAGLLGTQTFDASGQRQQLTNQYGVSDNLSRLTDIQTQLAKRNEKTALNKAQATEGGAGAMQAERALTLADKQAAIRNAGLAAEASVLQGNIETASTLINNAMSDFYQDRTLKNQNMIQQLDYYTGISDKQTSQLLAQEKRKYEEDQSKIERVQKSVESALASGATTPKEVAMLTDPKTTDNERLALAQLIQARGAMDLRDLQTKSAQMDLAVKAEQLAKLREPVVATRDTSVVDVNGSKQLIDTQTGEVIATFGADVSTDEIQQAKDVSFVNTLDTLKNHPGMAKAVGTTGLARWTPFSADVMSGEVSDFVGSTENIVKILTLNTFADAKAKGMTFGAMSQGEWDILGNSATKISQWRRERDDGSIYYDTSEKNMNKELDVLSNFGKMDAIRKGVAPDQIGVSIQNDGTYWTKNSNGSYTQLEISAPN